MITANELGTAVKVWLPGIHLRKKTPHCSTSAYLSGEQQGAAECSIVAERAGYVTRARLRLDGFAIELCLSKRFSTMGAEHELHAPGARLVDSVLDLRSIGIWQQHPLLTEALQPGYSRKVVNSWRGYPLLQEERLNSDGDVVQKGLRRPQLGALHAVASHWSVKTSHAKIVLPTGTGKTDVMVASSVMASALRTLVLVPSDALRTQVFNKFENLGVLHEIGVVGPDALRPVVGVLNKCPSELEDIWLLREANAVISTVQMLLDMNQSILKDFLSWFDVVMFDEAHHLPASSWVRINENIDEKSKILSVTATPYRSDGKRLPGELIYQFPLRLAQELGYFTPISVVKVDESNPGLADLAIAKAAVETLRRDEAVHDRKHLILARARTQIHADELYEIYEREFPDLAPVLLHSGVSATNRRSAIDGLRALHHRVVICVNMLGEGFDLPALKIAAMHEVHKTLPVTLQFIGRFTRANENVGGATAVINLAGPASESAVAELFSEDADWNVLIPDLSANAIRSEQNVESFLESMRASVSPEDRKFDLALLTPKSSVTMYKAASFKPNLLYKGIPRNSLLHQSWISDDGTMVVFVTRDIVFPDWSMSKDAAGFEWNMGIIAFDSDMELLYIHSTRGASGLSMLARAVGGQDALLVSGEKMFRVFDRVHRAVLHNVGLYRKGMVRFQMMAGWDVGSQVSSAVQAGSSKSNLFAVGYEDGKKVNVGASFKGRVWSMSTTSIPDWLAWAKNASRKILNDEIITNSFLEFTLIPIEVSCRPQIDVFACLPPDELLPADYHGEKKISIYNQSVSYSQLDLYFRFESAEQSAVLLSVGVDETDRSVFRLEWGELFRVIHEGGPRIRILEGLEEIDLENYLTSHAPPLLLRDGSELIGKHHFTLPTSSPYTFSPDSILPMNWGTTPIRHESKWSRRQRRSASVQGFMIDKCLEDERSDYVIDDDDSGEAADIIVINDNRTTKELEVTLYHCKYAAGDSPGARADDLYVVCGQAVRSSRLLHRPEALLAHIIRREDKLGGRPTRFEKGSLQGLRSLQRRIGLYRSRLSICIVQPGLSASALTPELSSILAAADNFVQEFTGRRLKVFGSP